MKVPENQKIQHLETSDAVVVRRRNPEVSKADAEKMQQARAQASQSVAGNDTVAVGLGSVISKELDPDKMLAERNEKKAKIAAMIAAGEYLDKVDSQLIAGTLDQGISDELAIAALIADKEKVQES